MKEIESNCFRILGVPSNASYEDIQDCGLALEKAAKLGVHKKSAWDFSFLGEFSRDQSAIREAMSRLNNPLQRIRERVYWISQESRIPDTLSSGDFQKLEIRINTNSSPMQRHDTALFYIACAEKIDPEMIVWPIWSFAIKSWIESIEDSSYWNMAYDLDKEQGFEPAATKFDIETVQNELNSRVLQYPVELFKDFVNRGVPLAAEKIMNNLLTETIPERYKDEAKYDVIYWLDDKLVQWKNEIEIACYNEIERNDEGIPKNKVICQRAQEKISAYVEPTVKLLEALSPGESSVSYKAKETLASCLYAVALASTWASEFSRSKSLLETAQNIAPPNSEIAEKIRNNLVQVNQSAQDENFYDDLRPIRSAPLLYTVNGIGFKIYGESEPDLRNRSYLTTHWFCILYVPIIPLSRYRVIPEGDGYRFIGKKPLSRWLKAWACAVIVMIAFALFYPSTPSNTSTRSSQSAPVSSQQVTSPSSPIPPQPGEKDTSSSLRNKINALKPQIDQLESQLLPMKSELESLQAQLDANRDNTAAYNAIVDKYNAKLSTYRSIYANYKALLDEHNRLVDQYNALKKR